LASTIPDRISTPSPTSFRWRLRPYFCCQASRPSSTCTRLARVADRVEAVGKALESADPDQANVLAAQLAYLHRRSLALDLAVVLGAVGGAATCGAVLALFVGALREATIASVLFALFGLAIFCALGAICAFTAEMLIASRGIRGEAAASRSTGPG
jgi:hypothetical protein